MIQSTDIQLLEKINEQIKSTGRIALVEGAFGDMEECGGILEGHFTPEDGGTFAKFWGCSYLFKGYPEKQVVEGLGLAKAMISLLPREMIAKSWVMKCALAVLYLFNRKKFIHFCHVYFSAIHLNVVEKLNIPFLRYNKFPKEIFRTVSVLVEREIKNKGYQVKVEDLLTELQHKTHRVEKWEHLELIAAITNFLCVFLELDSAYRFRLQDILALVDKESVKRDVVGEIRRLVNVMISREYYDYPTSVRDKISNAMRILVLFLGLSKYARQWARDFLVELDTEQVKMDESDWYFCLKRREYNFSGLSIEERLKEKERIDKEKGHTILKIRSDGNRGLEISV